MSLFRPPVAARRYLAAATSGFILAGILLPGAALAGPGTPPDPSPDTITTTEGAVATGNVLANDNNPGAGTLSVTGQGALSASVGTLVIAANGDYTFTPATNFFGTATTTYLVTNAKHTVSETITINVTNVNDAPTANNDTDHRRRGHGDQRHGRDPVQRHGSRQRHARSYVRLQRHRRQRRRGVGRGHVHG